VLVFLVAGKANLRSGELKKKKNTKTHQKWKTEKKQSD